MVKLLFMIQKLVIYDVTPTAQPGLESNDERWSRKQPIAKNMIWRRRMAYAALLSSLLLMRIPC